MSTIHLNATAGSDGVLYLEIPVGTAGEYEVVVSPMNSGNGTRKKSTEVIGWPAGYFESVLGSVTDESFELPVRRPAKPIKPLDQE